MTSPLTGEIGQTVIVDGHPVNALVSTGATSGLPLVLIHGSGPGASAWSNWRPILDDLAREHLVVAPDLYGFGATPPPAGMRLGARAWTDQVRGVMDALQLDEVAVVGNSYGGAIALRLAADEPARVRRVALTGAISLPHAITPGLRRIWSYEPSREAMHEVLTAFAHDPSRITDELVEQRYQATLLPGIAEAFRSTFREPLQSVLDEACLDAPTLRTIEQPTLIVHGRDDRIVPVASSIALADVLPHAYLRVFDDCGHWTAVERTADLLSELRPFLAAPDVSPED